MCMKSRNLFMRNFLSLIFQIFCDAVHLRCERLNTSINDLAHLRGASRIIALVRASKGPTLTKTAWTSRCMFHVVSRDQSQNIVNGHAIVFTDLINPCDFVFIIICYVMLLDIFNRAKDLISLFNNRGTTFRCRLFTIVVLCNHGLININNQLKHRSFRLGQMLDIIKASIGIF